MDRREIGGALPRVYSASPVVKRGGFNFLACKKLHEGFKVNFFGVIDKEQLHPKQLRPNEWGFHMSLGKTSACKITARRCFSV